MVRSAPLCPSKELTEYLLLVDGLIDGLVDCLDIGDIGIIGGASALV